MDKIVDIAIFDMYYILVESLFGSVLWAGLAFAVVLILMATLMKMSPLLQIMIVGMFAITFGIGYGGSLFAVAGFVLGLLYFSAGMYNVIVAKFYG